MLDWSCDSRLITTYRLKGLDEFGNVFIINGKGGNIIYIFHDTIMTSIHLIIACIIDSENIFIIRAKGGEYWINFS